MQSSLNAATLRQDLAFDQFVRVAGAAGFKGVELRYPAWVQHARAHGIEGLGKLFMDSGVQPAAFGWPPSLIRSSDQWEADLEAVAEVVDLAKALDIPGGMTVLPWRRDGVHVEDRGEMLDKLGRLADAAGDRHVYLEFIGLYAPPDQRGDFPQTVSAALEIVRELDRPNVGLLVDAFHWYLRGTLDEIAAIPSGTPIFCHVDDAPPGDRESLTDAMRVLPGEGVIDLPAFFAALRARGWDGFASLELFGEELRGMEPLEAARRAHAALSRLGID